MENKESAIILTSNDPFAGIILQSILSQETLLIRKVYFESERMGKESNWDVFRKVVRKSGWRYALYQSIELVGYSLILKALSTFGNPKIKMPKDLCKDYGLAIDYLDNDAIRNQTITFPEVDYLICVRFSKILKKHILRIPKKVAINFHGALLPKYAGLGSIFQALYNKEQYIGGSYHTMVEKIDGGKVLAQSKFEIDYTKSVAYHHLKVYYESSKIFSRAISNYNQGTTLGKDSDETEYYSFPEKSDVNSFKGKFISLGDFILVVHFFYSLRT